MVRFEIWVRFLFYTLMGKTTEVASIRKARMRQRFRFSHHPRPFFLGFREREGFHFLVLHLAERHAQQKVCSIHGNHTPVFLPSYPVGFDSILFSFAILLHACAQRPCGDGGRGVSIKPTSLCNPPAATQHHMHRKSSAVSLAH